MTSEAPSECYVYITLPGEIEPVTAGRFASAGNLLSQSARFLLQPPEAEAIIETMEKQVRASWYAAARGAGVSERDCARISSAFVYPGFRGALR